MLQGNGTKERSKEEEKGEEGDVWHRVTAGASRVASLLDALRWRQEGSIDKAWVLNRGVVRHGMVGNRGLILLSHPPQRKGNPQRHQELRMGHRLNRRNQ